MAGRAGTLAPLARNFYFGAPDLVAERVLGALLVRRDGKNMRIGRIVEVEAYLGSDDAAAHAYGGRTARNAVLFGAPGHAYVYFIYGMHYCLNFSCEPEGQAGCVLIRALEPVAGIEQMAQRRGLSAGVDPRLLTSGPGRLCKAFGITRAEHDGLDLTDPLSPLYIAQDGYVPGGLAVGPRVGISKAADRPLRFWLAGNRFVSGSRAFPASVSRREP